MIDAGALKAEWTKFSSLRATMALSVAAVLVSGLFGWMFSNAAAAEYATLTPQERLGFNPVELGMRGIFLVQVLLAGLGALIVSTEYGSGTITASMAAVGRRGRLLAAKAGMTVLSALPVSVASIVLMFTVSQSTLAAGGAPAATPGDTTAIQLLLGGPIVLTLISLFGLTLGVLLRSTAAAVNFSVVFLLLPILSSVMPGFLQVVVRFFWPNAAPFQAMYGAENVPDLLGYGLIVAFVVVMLAAAYVRFTRKDA
ncbi:hypothetical protein ACFMQL_07540 [Nonomuraea fastidiosa]|jgi:ABC-2 type transport system permease protein|uniref:hypothetical protein n=1 Tax=Nonomuraea TaxID=83681 RepID=UPI003246F3F3